MNRFDNLLSDGAGRKGQSNRTERLLDENLISADHLDLRPVSEL